MQATEIDPLHATLFASRILCWLWMGEENLALADAVQCRIMHPRWPKAWYREGVALGFKNYKGAVDAFLGALKLYPTSDEIKKALRQVLLFPIIATSN